MYYITSVDSLPGHTQVQLNTKTQVSNPQSADISSVVLNLQAQLNLLQIALEASARINSQSILDYLAPTQG